MEWLDRLMGVGYGFAIIAAFCGAKALFYWAACIFNTRQGCEYANVWNQYRNIAGLSFWLMVVWALLSMILCLLAKSAQG